MSQRNKDDKLNFRTELLDEIKDHLAVLVLCFLIDRGEEYQTYRLTDLAKILGTNKSTLKRKIEILKNLNFIFTKGAGNKADKKTEFLILNKALEYA